MKRIIATSLFVLATIALLGLSNASAAEELWVIKDGVLNKAALDWPDTEVDKRWFWPGVDLQRHWFWQRYVYCGGETVDGFYAVTRRIGNRHNHARFLTAKSAVGDCEFKVVFSCTPRDSAKDKPSIFIRDRGRLQFERDGGAIRLNSRKRRRPLKGFRARCPANVYDGQLHSMAVKRVGGKISFYYDGKKLNEQPIDPDTKLYIWFDSLQAAPKIKSVKLTAEKLADKRAGGVKSPASPADRAALGLDDVASRRVWTRYGSAGATPDHPFVFPLRFFYEPANWRDPWHGLLPSKGLDHRADDADVRAEAFEVELTINSGQAKQIAVELAGCGAVWDRETQSFEGGGKVAVDGKRLFLRLVLQDGAMTVFDRVGAVVAGPVAGPAMPRIPELKVTARGGGAGLDRFQVFGLRSPELSPEAKRLASKAEKDDRVFYKNKSYTIHGGWVDDRVYGPPFAWAPEPGTIVSPTRMIEGFLLDLHYWRKPSRLRGRVIDRETIWHPDPRIEKFAQIHTGWPTVDAACKVALDVLERCGNGDFAADRRQTGRWQAGLLFGPRAGFGVWVRDTTHIGMRGGNLLDPKRSKASLEFTLYGGKDNATDGPPMPIVGVWDYTLATADDSLVRAHWPRLKALAGKMDARFDANRGLVRAAMSTSNDHFREPEAGGFALSTEAYMMLAYLAMAEFGDLMKEDPGRVKAWRDRGELIRRNIRDLYWNPKHGIYTSGPKGSASYERGYWESAGVEATMRRRFGIASPEQVRSMLKKLPEKAMNEFGVNVFPYRKETDHFRNAAWIAWTVGMAEAAGREGRLDLLHQFIAQHTRHAVLMKTFYEVVDYRSGRVWRWPGQLWAATGFLSYFYHGVLGIEYDLNGMTLRPAVPKALADMKVTNLKFRNATYNITVKGWGADGKVLLDGKEVDRIPGDLKGAHQIDLVMRSKAKR